MRADVLRYSRRKLSVDDGTARRRPLPTSASDDVPAVVNVEEGRRRSAWSPMQQHQSARVSTLSRTLSEHTLDRSTRYRGALSQCRDDLLDEWTIDADTESVLSPPRIAPVSGQLSLVCRSDVRCL